VGIFVFLNKIKLHQLLSCQILFNIKVNNKLLPDSNAY